MAAPKYRPIDFSDEVTLDAGLAYAQASQALDSAAAIAVSSADAETLTTVAALWMRIGESLVHADEEDGETETVVEVSSTGLGFNNNHKENENG